MIGSDSAFYPLFEGLTDGVCLTRGDGRIEYLNPAAERMLDVRLAEVRDRSLCELLCGRLSTGDCSDCSAACSLRRHDSPDRAVTFNGRHGPRVAYEWKEQDFKRVERWRNLRVHCLKSSAPWIDGFEEGRRFTLIEDVSAEAELARRKEEWRNMVAHDLRSPLTTVLATLKELEAKAAGQALTPAEIVLVEAASRNCVKMAELLDLYLDEAKLESGLAAPRLSAVDAAALARQAVEEKLPQTRSRRQTVQVEAPPELPAVAEPALLKRVIDNVLDNAVKYTPEGGIIRVSAGTADGSAFISVRDSGPGIDPAAADRLFSPYYQAEGRAAGKIKGTGLGLAFCREAMKAMKGSIELALPERGAEFRLRLARPGGRP